MESFLNFFENIPSELRSGIFVGGLLFFWILEGAVPLFKINYRRWRHAGINVLFNIMALVVGLGFAWLLLTTSDFTTTNKFGLLYLFELPVWLHVVLGVLLLDLVGAYFIHWVEHKVRWMWKFHLVHHSDTNVDVTTGLRHHPGEIVFRSSFTILGVLLLGLPMGIIMFYQTLSVIFAQITHANIKMPRSIDRALSLIFVTPLMHKVHHHFERPLTDTNFGNIFSVWDRLFGTFAQVENTTELKYGVDTHMDPAENDNVRNLLAIPFQKYRTLEKPLADESAPTTT